VRVYMNNDRRGVRVNPAIQCRLADVRSIMLDSLGETCLGPRTDDFAEIVGGGKMLRARLALRIGAATGISPKTCMFSAAAVEMIHAASLLHDDVIDNARLRRGLPSLWVRKGSSAAILIGDLLVCRAMAIMDNVEDGILMPVLVRFAGEMCDAESQQELLLSDRAPDWATCVSIARRKTGSLFAFAAYVCGGADARLRDVLQESGYAVGTAYQLADDLLDAYGNPSASNKTLGNDAAGSKTTAASSWRAQGIDPKAYITGMCRESCETLAPWPAVAGAWDEYLAEDVRPVIDRFVEKFSPEYAS